MTAKPRSFLIALSVLLGASILGSSVSAAPQEALTMSETWGPWMQVYGRIHFALVHFPIGLLIAAGIIELCRVRSMGPRPCSATLVCLGLGWVAAALAAYSGWTYAAVEGHGHPADGLIYWHRWGGVGVAVAGFLTWSFGLLGRSGKRNWARTCFTLLLFVTTIGTGVVGHLGGNLMHGEDYLFEPFDEKEITRREKRIEARMAEDEEPVEAGEPTASEPESGTDTQTDTPAETPAESSVDVTELETGAAGAGAIPNPAEVEDPEEETSEAEVEVPSVDPALVREISSDEAAAYAKVQPILELTCYHCHGPRKAKGGLRLHEFERIFEADQSEWVIVPGHPEKSELVRLISLPTGHEDSMPSDEDPLVRDEVDLVIAWIRSMDPVAHGLPVDGGTAGSEIFGDWSEVVSDPFGDPPAETETPVTDGPTDTVDLTNLTAPTPVGSPAAMAALVERGALANRISADSPMVDVVFGLLRESAGDDDLALLAGLETVLSSLDLSGTAVTDGGLLALTGFKQIERLHLENTAVGDAGLAHLSDLKALTYLNLYGTAVTDAGLQQLAELGSLRKLFLWQTAVTDAGAEELQLQLPELAIIRGVDVLELPPALVIVEGATTFAEHVGPIFSAKCTSCHGAEEPAAGLRFDTFDAVFEKTWAEWAVKPGDTESSRLIAALRLEPGTKGAMPKKGDPLTAEELGLVVAWVEGLHEEEVDTLEVDTEEGQDEDL